MSPTTRCLAILVIAACAVNCSALNCFAAEESPTTPKERTDALGKSQLKEINADLKTLGEKVDLAFVGDSITRRWRGEGNKEVWNKYWGSYKAVNMGIGGDQTQNVL